MKWIAMLALLLVAACGGSGGGAIVDGGPDGGRPGPGRGRELAGDGGSGEVLAVSVVDALAAQGPEVSGPDSLAVVAPDALAVSGPDSLPGWDALPVDDARRTICPKVAGRYYQQNAGCDGYYSDTKPFTCWLGNTIQGETGPWVPMGAPCFLDRAGRTDFGPSWVSGWYVSSCSQCAAVDK